jgi:hypothetical protein
LVCVWRIGYHHRYLHAIGETQRLDLREDRQLDA